MTGNNYMSIKGDTGKEYMLTIDKIDLIDFLIKEIDDLEPKYAQYPYYCRDLLNNPNDVYKNDLESRKLFIKEICKLEKTELIDYMIKHYFYYFDSN
jgi:hypothetical protein